MTEDLTARVLAAIEEREAAAHAAQEEWGDDEGDRWEDYELSGKLDDAGWSDAQGLDRHWQLNGPAAVLRRCAADRRVLARHSPMPGTFPELPPVCTYCEENDSHGARVLWPCEDFVDLASAHGIAVQVASS